MLEISVNFERLVLGCIEGNLIRQFGIKTLLIVPENHVAGAFRVGGQHAAGHDGAGEQDGE